MSTHPEPFTLREQVEAARVQLSSARGSLHTLLEDVVADLFTSLLQLQATAEGLAVALAVEADTRGVIAASTATGVGGWVQARAADAGVQVSGPTANAWQQVVREAKALDMSVFADAVTSGRVGVSRGAVLAKELRRIRSQVPAATWDACAGEVIEYAAGGASPTKLAEIRDTVISQYGDDPEYLEKRERVAHLCRELSRFRVDPDGLRVARLAFDAAYAAIFEGVIEALSAPRPAGTIHPLTGQPLGADDRSAGQRRADALINLCRALATHPDAPPMDLPPFPGATASRESATDEQAGADGQTATSRSTATGGQAAAESADTTTTDGGSDRRAASESAMASGTTTGAGNAGAGCAGGGAGSGPVPGAGPAGATRSKARLVGWPQIVITMGFESLRDQCGYGLTQFGQPLSPATVRAFACEAKVVPMVLGSQKEILDQGRGVRTATAGQWAHLRHRDKGCTFPGCDRPPGYCHAHHVTHWVNGGSSDVSNMALLCTRHHLIVHRDNYTAGVTSTGVTWHLDRPPPPPLPLRRC